MTVSKYAALTVDQLKKELTHRQITFNGKATKPQLCTLLDRSDLPAGAAEPASSMPPGAETEAQAAAPVVVETTVKVTQSDIDAAAASKVTDADIAKQASLLLDRIPVTDNQVQRIFGDADLTSEQKVHIKRVKAGGAALCQIMLNEVRSNETRREVIRQIRAATMLAVSTISHHE